MCEVGCTGVVGDMLSYSWEAKGNNTVVYCPPETSKKTDVYENELETQRHCSRRRRYLYNKLLPSVDMTARHHHLEFELAMAVIVAPLFVFSDGTAGGFRRLAGVGGADLR